MLYVISSKFLINIIDVLNRFLVVILVYSPWLGFHSIPYPESRASALDLWDFLQRGG